MCVWVAVWVVARELLEVARELWMIARAMLKINDKNVIKQCCDTA